MLRTKQIGPLSQCARSFFLNGSRSSTADGSSSAYSEDETYVPKKQHRNNEVVLPQKDSTLVSKSAARTGTLLSGDAGGAIGYQKAENGAYPTSAAHVLSAPSSSLISGGVSSVGDDVYATKKDGVHSSALVSDHLVKAGIAAVNVLSDLVNYKIPFSDGKDILHSSPNSVVDTTSSISSIRSSNIKPQKRENFSMVNGKPSVQIGESTSTVHCHGPKGKAEKSAPVKATDQIPSKAPRNSVETRSVPSGTRYQRQSVPHRSKTTSYRAVSKSKSGQASEPKATGGISEGIRSADNVQKPSTYARMPTGVVPLARHTMMNNGHAVERVYNILQHVKWGPAAEEALENLNCSLDAYQANQVLKQLQDHSVALGFFYWLKRRPWFKHDGHTYTTMVGTLGRARKFGYINRLLDEMVRDGCLPNVVTYNRLIHSYGRANYLDEAINVFHRMQEVGCEPDRVTYCTLIDIHAKAGYLDVAMAMYQRMQQAGLSPDTFTYSVIINCLGKAGHLAAAYKLFCEMVAQGCVPNLVTYNIMIALQAKARNYTCALKLYRDMQTAGFQPDKVTYSIVMEVLGLCGYLDEAEVVFAEMKQKNWVPDEPVYGLLVDLWGKAGNVDKARGWYQAMLDAGLRPNVPTCNSLLSAFLRMHRISDAYDVLQSMLKLGLHPSLQTYTLLLSCCTDETVFHIDMGSCWELMAITGHPAHAFLVSMPPSGLNGGQNVRDHASNFFDLMHSEDRESKRGLVDAVIDFLHKSGLKEEAGSVWEVAALKNVYPDAVREKSSCYWLINLHVMSNGTAITALSRTLAWFRRKMLASGVGPSRIDIVTGWGRRSRVTGSSLVRQSVHELLHMFQFPFISENGNSGCFVGCGESLNRWLLQSYVERMHLL
ncbi:Smr protein/MutS2 C-terminal [Macleaya cordata]|uniref:Smr protein/MutS2 C-terminal n=1 Tax=Macleaya cordata TaxID=56857 RepID=A0A200QNH0_MACCD|nr:Smr protein/MutS2 C-terminal [Macleaya cordata]